MSAAGPPGKLESGVLERAEGPAFILRHRGCDAMSPREQEVSPSGCFEAQPEPKQNGVSTEYRTLPRSMEVGHVSMEMKRRGLTMPIGVRIKGW